MHRKDIIKKLLLTTPEDPFLHYALALEMEKSGDLPSAVEILSSLKQSQPTFLPLYFRLGTWLERLGKTKNAIEIWQEGLILAHKQADNKTYKEIAAAIEEAIY